MGLKSGIFISPVSTRHLKKKLAELEKAPKELQRILKHEANQTVGRMKQDAPVDTGRLRRKIETEVRLDNEVIVTSEAIDPRTGVDYAPLQEYGIGVPERRYFRKNIDILRFRLKERINRALININNKI